MTANAPIPPIACCINSFRLIPGLASFSFVVATPFILLALPIIAAIRMELPIVPSIPSVGLHHAILFVFGLLVIAVVLSCILFFTALIIVHCIFRR